MWYWGGRYIPWLARLVFFFWAGSYAAWRLFSFGSMTSLLTGAIVVLAVICAGEVGQFRSRREAVLRREADARQFDVVKSDEAVANEAALLALGFVRRGDCVSTKGAAIVRRRIFVHRERRTIVAALFHTSAMTPADKSKPKSAPEERSVAPTSLSMISYGMNGSVVRSRATAQGDKPMRPIPRELVEDFPSASAADLLSAHSRRIADVEARDHTRMIEVNEWSAFALADALDDAWARRIESFGWTPMAYRMLVADFRWLRELPFLTQAGAVLAIIVAGPGLFLFGSGAFMNRDSSWHPLPFQATALGAKYDVGHPPVYPGAVIQPEDSVRDPGSTWTVYLAPAPIETVLKWYENRMPPDASESSAQLGDHEYVRFQIRRSGAQEIITISQDTAAATGVDIVVSQAH